MCVCRCVYIFLCILGVYGVNVFLKIGFNSSVRLQNIFGNKQAPSRDIAIHFAIVEHLRYICGGGKYNGDERLVISDTCINIFKAYTDVVKVLRIFTTHMRCKAL